MLAILVRYPRNHTSQIDEYVKTDNQAKTYQRTYIFFIFI